MPATAAATAAAATLTAAPVMPLLALLLFRLQAAAVATVAAVVGKLFIVKLFVVELLLLLRLLLILLLEQPTDGGSRKDDITADKVGASILFQLNFTRFLGGPIGGICWVASARNASAIRCGWLPIIFCHPDVSITSVG